MSILQQQWIGRLTRAAVRDEDGQIIPWVLFMMFFLLGMCALSVDVGHALLVQRELQASTDAAALAAAQRIEAGDWQTYALNYSAATGKYNQYTEYGTSTPTITGYCSTTVAKWLNSTCTSTTSPVNAVYVTETVSVPMFFTQYIHIPTLTVSATATASRGAKPLPYNIAIILDTTPSMNDTDSSCKDSTGAVVMVNGKTATQLQCATIGVQELLTGMAPSVDYISLFTFPNVTTTSVSYDTDCSSSTNPYVTAYTFPSTTATSLSNASYTGAIYNVSGQQVSSGTYTSTYQVTGFLNNYRSSDSSTALSTSSSLSNAAGYGSSSSCSAMQTSYENTYYAAAIYAAQASLVAEQAARLAAGQSSGNAIIFLSDGNATAQEQYPPTGNSFRVGGTTYSAGTFYPGYNDMATGTQSGTAATDSGIYPSWVAQCNQGIAAANAATNAGTIVFTIAYGSPTTSSNGNCGSDRNLGSSLTGAPLKYTPNVTPCQAMQLMSSGYPNNKSHFFSDSTVSGNNSNCTATNGLTDFQDIFDAIRGQLTAARLIPNGTT